MHTDIVYSPLKGICHFLPSDLILGESLYPFRHLSGDNEQIFLCLLEKSYFDKKSERLQDNSQYSLRTQTQCH